MNKNKMTRRDFLAAGTVATAAVSGFPFVHKTRAQSVKPLKIGLIGCGGRGTGAAIDALTAAPDMHLIALADPFQDRIDLCLKTLKDPKGSYGDRSSIEIKPDHIFTGMDCAQKLLETDIDIAFLVTPPGSRPLTFELAVNAGKHIFMEKPIATDPVGIRKVRKTAEKAKAKGLSVVVGLNYRHSKRIIENAKRIQDGQIGEIRYLRVTRNGGGMWDWHRGDKRPIWTEMEYQCRNWYYFCWLSGDQITEQAIHHNAVINQVMGGPPISAYGSGGRMSRTDPKFGNIWDNMSVDFEYPGGVHLAHTNRHWENCANRTENYVVGTLGESNGLGIITGKNPWKGERDVVRHTVYEHWELIDSIRNGQPRNDVLDFGADDTLTTIMGRESCYTGKVITWDEISNSDLDLFPKGEIKFGPAPQRPVPIPGKPRPV
ncbi:Gfo/Idh/MocA family protein [candidate division KSB1 bacterium]